jgi:hypothetical protein
MKSEIIDKIESFLSSQIQMFEMFGESKQLEKLKEQLSHFKIREHVINDGLKQGLSLEHMERLVLKYLRLMLINIGYPSDEELFGLSEDADYESESGDTNAMGDTDAMNVSEAGNVKGIKIEIPGNSYASDFGKAAAREVVESFGPREYRSFLEAFLNEFKKITGGV